MASTVKTIKAGVSEQIKKMMDRSRNMGQFLTVAYRKYQNYQRTRWQTENAENGSWLPVTLAYGNYKRVKFADYPGNGTKLLIATGDLLASVVGTKTDYHRKLITGTTLKVSTTLGYASYVNEVRPFDEFSPAFYQDIKNDLQKYLMKGFL